MRRSASILAAAFALTACDKQLHGLFEGPPPPEGRISLALQATALAVPRGGEQTVSVTATKIGDVPGNLELTVQGLPSGVVVVLDTLAATATVTTITVTFRVQAAAVAGSYPLTIRGHADPSSNASAFLVLSITEPPSFDVSLSKAAVTIARGGIGRVSAAIARTNLSSPVTFTLDAAPGVSATFTNVTADQTDMTIAVASDAASGARTLTIRAAAPGLSDRTATIALTVSTDPVQLIIADATLSATQASMVASDIIVNHAGAAAVALSIENLPAGITAEFRPTPVTGNVATMTLSVGAAVAAGTYRGLVRGRSDGVNDATADFVITVGVAGISLSVAPQAITVFPGTTASASVSLTRVAFTGVVVVTVDGVPTGVTVTPQPSAVTGTTATLAIAASSAATAGQYTLTVRATPDGLSAAAVKTATFDLAVRPAPSGDGNVLLDWSRCAVPTWIASQDGAGAWTQQLPVGGVVRFAVNSGKGGFAFAVSGNTVIRYMTQAELTSQPFDMCPPVTKSVSGVGIHATTSERSDYHLGGGTGSSTSAAPNFVITGVREGVHDLVVWGTSGLSRGTRALFRRDLDIPNGGSIGNVDLNTDDGFTPISTNLTINGPVVSGEQLFLTMDYLTTAACTANPLYSFATSGTFSNGTVNFSLGFLGVPDASQRPTDFHLATALLSAGSSSRSIAMAFHSFSARTIALPPLMPAPVVTVIPGGYKRLQSTVSSLPAAYDRAATLRYADGARAMSMSATSGYVGGTNFVLAMPDFSGTSGWSNSFAIDANATGTWTFDVEGGSAGATLCNEGARALSAKRTGTF